MFIVVEVLQQVCKSKYMWFIFSILTFHIFWIISIGLGRGIPGSIREGREGDA
jgi:hypothetical protein